MKTFDELHEEHEKQLKQARQSLWGDMPFHIEFNTIVDQSGKVVATSEDGSNWTVVEGFSHLDSAISKFLEQVNRNRSKASLAQK